MFEIIIQKIKSILIANDEIGIVYDYEAGDFKGDPAAIVVPSSNESDYNTTQENIRIYAFTIRLFVKRTKPRTDDSAEVLMRRMVSTVLDDFDKDYTFSGLESPAGYTFINTFATPSSWGYAGREDEYRVSEISIRCRVSVDVTAIS